ncbi:efflux RND transporter periplasmic adaptor subunit [Ornithinibacillus halophilus]|uniref:RND family efflux transporter, MFP subunit n=1 Tax=Ornithinibacillus halophilus TaxID=930117 RepID=A0A1M5EC81_9BACI|nr:efflux RND transporter periplasmic adaptor subunit [Ornithinibacillus halophilus]SHF76691.1 RND family efflux transporter, MFP subunit [Ornithinibacillus halophilus]
MKNVWKGLAAIVFVTIFLAACTEEEETESVEPVDVPVEVAQVTEGELVIEKSIFGRTAPNSLTPVMLQNPGEVDELDVKNGDVVEEDDVLATIATPAGMQEITASASGKIINLEAEEGDLVSNSDPFLMIMDNEKMTLNFTVTADMRNHLGKYEKHTAIIDGNEYEASITSVGEMPGENGLYPVEASVDNDDEAIITGLVAELVVEVNKLEDTLIVPTEAIVENSDGAFVYVVAEDEVKLVEIKVLETQSNESAIEGDLADGDEVVTSGQLLLADGTKIEVVTESGE